MTAPVPAAPEAPVAPAPVTPAPNAPTAPAATPPWASEGDFDPAKAWSLIEGLRADKEKLSARPALTDEQQKQLNEYNALVEASKSDQQRLQEAEAAARRDADTAKSDATALRIAIKHGLGEADIDLLGSGTEEQVNARAQRIADLRAAAAPGTPTPVPGQRPVEQLRPGATPTDAKTEDDVIYERLFGPPAK